MASRHVLVAGLAIVVLAAAASAYFVLNPSGGSSSESAAEPAKDYYQRSLAIYEFKMAADSGAERGREIFYYKCWFCHNEFVQSAPTLVNLFERKTTIFGTPMSEDAVRKQIMDGSPGMPAYKHTLNASDVTDLLTFIREDCCWDNDAPPLNPRYKFSRAPDGRATGE